MNELHLLNWLLLQSAGKVRHDERNKCLYFPIVLVLVAECRIANYARSWRRPRGAT